MDIFYGNGNENHALRTEFFVHKRTISVFMRVEFVSDTCHIILRGHWCSIVLNVYAHQRVEPIIFQQTCHNMKGRFFEELECIFNKLPKYHRKFI